MSERYFTYTFGDFVLDTKSKSLTDKGEPVEFLDKTRKIKFSNQYYSLLLKLLEKHGNSVTKSELKQAIWGTRKAPEKNDSDLYPFISRLKKVLRISEIDVSQAERRALIFEIVTTREGGYKLQIEEKDLLKEPKIENSSNLELIASVELAQQNQTTENHGSTVSDNGEIPLANTTNAHPTSTTHANTVPNSGSDFVEAGNLEFGQIFGLGLLTGVHIIPVVIILACVLYGIFLSGSPLLLVRQYEFVYVLYNSICYALLIVVCLYLEIAYEFRKYNRSAREIRIPVFLINLSVMIAAFGAAYLLLPSELGRAIGAGALILAAGTVGTCLLARRVVPNRPLVFATFATQPAFAAFCKNTVYWLVASILFGLTPFCLFFHPDALFVSYIYPLCLLVVFTVAAPTFAIGTFYTIIDRLKTKPTADGDADKTLYTNLLFLRLLWILPSAINLFWYLFWSLQRITGK